MGGIRARFLLRRLTGLSLAVGLALSLAAATAVAAPRIVAVGDVHGDVPTLKKVLVEAGVLDAAGAWVGGDTVLVQVGDLIDRGPQMRGALDLVMELERRPPKHGGRVVSLLGNHEVMNMTAICATSFPRTTRSLRTPDRRSAAPTHGFRSGICGRSAPASSGNPSRPPGRRSRRPGSRSTRQASSSTGRRSVPTAPTAAGCAPGPRTFSSAGTAFVHGGISPALGDASLAEIDRRVHEDLATFDADQERFVAEGLILPFFDLEETTRAVREELLALTAAETASRAACRQRHRPRRRGAPSPGRPSASRRRPTRP